MSYWYEETDDYSPPPPPDPPGDGGGGGGGPISEPTTKVFDGNVLIKGTLDVWQRTDTAVVQDVTTIHNYLRVLNPEPSDPAATVAIVEGTAEVDGNLEVSGPIEFLEGLYLTKANAEPEQIVDAEGFMDWNRVRDIPLPIEQLLSANEGVILNLTEEVAKRVIAEERDQLMLFLQQNDPEIYSYFVSKGYFDQIAP